ncbi:hypothetical protein SLU01_08510 [Sporosarcina luteola]|uniref:DUF3899 domain-containing protein n=1 Tax=Sporosarcina luteola TaxID=582850 RepID=A0A511Z522_9BACL|nr:DUF3899 domain-containing protein [Sporosarcina luteola]GEN82539.1 hypothetical protein SLU01_08510 [Sporosarcina luteola]
MKRISINIIVSQLLIFVLIYILYRNVTVLDYINISFYVGGLLLFIGLALLLFQSGFFDFFSTSVKKVFYRKHVQEDIMSMRKPSEALSMKSTFFFMTGIPIILFMLVTLFIYSS